MKHVLGLLGLCVFAAACAAEEAPMTPDFQWATLDGTPPLIIAHRGASGYAPEHTRYAYALAIEQGTDVIEPDLVVTKDGVLVARHDRYLSATTDVADYLEFADRKRTDAYAAQSEGVTREDWWVEDFTYAELRTLRARQSRKGRTTAHDGKFEIMTFADILALVSEKAAQAGRPVGIYPETKHPGYFASIGLDFEKPLLEALEGFDAGLVFIQSFEPEILKRLRGKTDAKLVQLVYEKTPGAGPNIPLEEIATYADGVGAAKSLAFDPGSENVYSDFVRNAHRQSLFVHFWTFRNDEPNQQIVDFASEKIISKQECVSNPQNPSGSCIHQAEIALPLDDARSPDLEYLIYYSAGADGFFTDFPDTAVGVRENIIQ